MILDEKNLNLMNNLIKQYEENLTQKQKEALIRYNSGLFIFFNKIVSIDGYENMSIDELYKFMKPFIERYSYVIKNFTRFIDENYFHEDELKRIISSVIDEDVMVYDSIVDGVGRKDCIPEEYFLHEILKIFVEDGVISSESYNEDDIVSCRKVFDFVSCDEYNDAEKKYKILMEKRFEKIFKKLLFNLLKDIKIIKSIPESSIVLPEDTIVYRGIRSDDEINPEILSTSDFVSTSLSRDIASQYITKREGNNDLLLSIKIPKGTSVFVFPQTVKNDGQCVYNLFLSKDIRIFEIMFDKTKSKNIQIVDVETFTHSHNL